jgi:pyrimidine operon attenuation protein / uracil phosphoribosyltransferase
MGRGGGNIGSYRGLERLILAFTTSRFTSSRFTTTSSPTKAGPPRPTACLSFDHTCLTFHPMRTLYDEADVQRAVGQLATAVSSAFSPQKPLVIVGIRTRGETLAQRLTDLLQSRGFGQIDRGVVDITLYRDDLSEIGPRPMVRPTHLTADINAKPLLLVDDVLFTGRSVRAGLDALSDFGRPSAIRLAVLVDRGGRELPIQADFIGLTLKDVPADHRVNVRLKEIDGKDEITVEPKG